MFIITEYEEIIDVCTTEVNAKKARKFWIEDRLKANSHCDDYTREEANETIKYKEYKPDQNLLD